MRAKLIDANALKEHIGSYTGKFTDELGFVVRLDAVLRGIDFAPTVDAVEVVHGRWETDKEDIEWGNSLKRKHCTNCGKRPHFDKDKREFVLSNFCHHCGAKMDGKED